MKTKNKNRVSLQPSVIRSPRRLYPYRGFLGVNNQDGAPSSYGGVANWENEFVPVQESLLLDCIRFPQGTYSNWFDWGLQKLSLAKAQIFDKPEVSAAFQAQITARGEEDRMPFPAFFSFVDALATQPTHIFSVINVYTQTYNEIVAGITAYKAACGNRAICWEIGNELSASNYADYANTAFSTLIGDDLITALSYFPSGQFASDGGDLAVKCKQVISHIRTNYPGDKIGISSTSELGHRRPDTGSGGFQAFESAADDWAITLRSLIPDVDAVIEHPYITPSDHWAVLNNAGVALYSDAKWLTGITEPTENTYRWMMAFAQDGPKWSTYYNARRWRDKELWITEVGNLIDHDEVETATNRPTEINACTTQSVALYLWVVSDLISWCEQIIANDGRIRCVMYHAATRSVAGSPAASHFNTTIAPAPIAMTALGIAYYLLNKIKVGQTDFAVPIIHVDQGLCRFGVLNYNGTRILPVRALYFEGAEQRLLVVNISPEARTVSIPFTSYSVHGFNPANNGLSLWSSIPDQTFFDSTDFFSDSGASTTYLVPAYSCFVFTNTGPAVYMGGDIGLSVT